MGIKVSLDWQGEIFSGVKRYAGRLSDITSEQVGWELIEALLERYVEVAQKAMGSVSARGGYPHIDFEGATPERWKALSIFTVAKKNGINTARLFAYTPHGQEILKSAWDSFVDSTNIWEYTGSAKENLTVNADGSVTTNAYVERVEKGGTGSWGKQVPARPLFAVLNEAFLQWLKKELRNKKSDLYRHIRRDLKKKGLWA
jgi:hypothetical protein